MNKLIRIACIACFGAGLVAAAPTRSGQGEVTYDFFYNALAPSGTWFESADFGYVWQPRVAAESNDWKPYTDGYWSQTDQGWTWISYEDFGWATYHYGRWAQIADAGWVWVPGFQWAPAWVAWRASPSMTGRPASSSVGTDPSAVSVESDVVVGWAPLPPAAAFDEQRGFSAQVDLTFGIGPDLYCFVPARDLGESVIRPWIIRPTGNRAFFALTWNCTSLVFQSSAGYILSSSPNFWSLRAVVQTPIPRLNLEPHYISGSTPMSEVANRVDNEQFIVAAPTILPPRGLSAGSIGLPVGTGTRPPKILGGSIPARAIELGWREVNPDEAAILHDQIKREAAAAPAKPIILPALTKPTNVILAQASLPGPAKHSEEKKPKSGHVTQSSQRGLERDKSHSLARPEKAGVKPGDD